MGNYATIAEFKLRFEDDAQVAFLTKDTDSLVPNETVLSGYVDASESLINSYVGVRYLIPVSTSDAGVAAHLKGITLDIAVRQLHASSGTVPESTEKSYDRAIEWLILISEGTLVLPSAATSASTESNDPQILWGTGEFNTDETFRNLGRETMKNI